MQLFAFLYSGGQVSQGIYNDLSGVCPHGPPDIFGRATLRRDCAQNHLVDAVEKNFLNGPWAVDYLRQSNAQMRADYAGNLLQTAYSPATSSESFIEASEITTMSVVLHYAEAVMTRFDQDQDGKLNDDEVRRATPLFVEFIQIMARQSGRGNFDYAWSEAIFRLMLEKQGMPEWYNAMGVLDQWGEWTIGVDLGFWKAELPIVRKPPVTLDRTGMSKVFRAIVQELYKASAPAQD
jgi:hypothetical protein